MGVLTKGSCLSGSSKLADAEAEADTDTVVAATKRRDVIVKAFISIDYTLRYSCWTGSNRKGGIVMLEDLLSLEYKADAVRVIIMVYWTYRYQMS
jgi:hypothetical protein